MKGYEWGRSFAVFATVLNKPEEQNQTCLDSALAEKGRMKSKERGRKNEREKVNLFPKTFNHAVFTLPFPRLYEPISS